MADDKAQPGQTMIALTDAQWDQFEAQSDRIQPSPYQEQVDGAAVGDKFAIPLPTEEQIAAGAPKERLIVNNLHKAARVAGKGIQVMVRKNANPPAVLWRIVDGGYVKPERKPKTESENAGVPAETTTTA